MALVLTNNATSTLAANINSSVTSINVTAGDAGKFPAVTAGNWFPLTIEDAIGNMEIVKVTARAGATMTVVRAQEGTTAKAFSAGARVDLRLTAAALDTKLDVNTAAADSAKLGSQDPNFYRNANNLSAGTVSDARLPARINTAAVTVTDWDTIVENGWYRGNGAANAPVAGWLLCEVYAQSTINVVQTVHLITALSPNDTQMYRRMRSSAGWAAWYRLRVAEAEQQALWDARYEPWAMQPIGVLIPLLDNLAGVAAPPKDKAYRYVLLTAGETDSGEYNEGILTSESVSGSSPLVVATAVISLAGSPVNGRTINLINTERRFLRAGTAGSVENDAMQQITGAFDLRVTNNGAHLTSAWTGALSSVAGSGTSTVQAASSGPVNTRVALDSANSPNARTADETRPKNLGVTYYMRVK